MLRAIRYELRPNATQRSLINRTCGCCRFVYNSALAFAKENQGYTVGIDSLGSQDTIAPAVTKGNTSLLNWINDEIKALAGEQFFHADYEATLVETYGLDYEDSLVIEGGEAAK